jgi:DNA repair protein RecO (recombination protein O)
MLSKTRAIVLHAVKYGESGLIVHVYTEHFGRISLLIHGVRKVKSRVNPSHFEVLSLLDIELYRKESRSIQNLKEVRSCLVFYHIRSDIRKSTIALFLAEFLYRTLREEESNPSLFNYLFHAIQVLEITDKGVENLTLILLMQFSKFLGIYPKNNSELIHYCSAAGIQLTDIIDLSLADLEKLKLSHNKRYELLEYLLDYYADHLEGMGRLKSLPVLKEVFH